MARELDAIVLPVPEETAVVMSHNERIADYLWPVAPVSPHQGNVEVVPHTAAALKDGEGA